jgi:hypothetical protein
VVPARAGRPHKMSAPGGAVKPEVAGGVPRPSAALPMHGSSGGLMNGRREEFHGCMSVVYRPVQGQTRTKPLRQVLCRLTPLRSPTGPASSPSPTTLRRTLEAVGSMPWCGGGHFGVRNHRVPSTPTTLRLLFLLQGTCYRPLEINRLQACPGDSIGEQAHGQYSRPASNPKALPRFFARETKSPRQATPHPTARLASASQTVASVYSSCSYSASSSSVQPLSSSFEAGRYAINHWQARSASSLTRRAKAFGCG